MMTLPHRIVRFLYENEGKGFQVHQIAHALEVTCDEVDKVLSKLYGRKLLTRFKLLGNNRSRYFHWVAVRTTCEAYLDRQRGPVADPVKKLLVLQQLHRHTAGAAKQVLQEIIDDYRKFTELGDRDVLLTRKDQDLAAVPQSLRVPLHSGTG